MSPARFAFCLTAAALLLSPPGAAPAEPPPTLTMRVYDERVQRGVDLIYNLRFEEADRYFDELVASYPDNPLGYFFRAMVAWWRVLIDLDDTSHDEAFYRRIDECIEICDARLGIDPDDFDAILFKGGAIGFRGRLRGDRRQMLRAAQDGLRSLPLLERSRKMEPTNKDILFGQGIYNYFRDVIPQKYPIVRAVTWMLKDGDRETGLRQLREVAAEGRYAKAEAKYFLAQIYRLFEEDEAAALPYLEELRSRYPPNSIFHRYTARTYASLNRWDRALPLYREVVERSEAGARGVPPARPYRGPLLPGKFRLHPQPARRGGAAAGRGRQPQPRSGRASQGPGSRRLRGPFQPLPRHGSRRSGAPRAGPGALRPGPRAAGAREQPRARRGPREEAVPPAAVAGFRRLPAPVQESSSHCLRISNSTTAQALATLSEFLKPKTGISTSSSQARSTSSPTPRASLPSTRATGRG